MNFYIKKRDTLHVETLAVLERNGSRGSTPTEKPKRDADGREMS